MYKGRGRRVLGDYKELQEGGASKTEQGVEIKLEC